MNSSITLNTKELSYSLARFLRIDNKGWLQSVELVPSPNCDARPDQSSIKLIVLHGISLPPGQFGGGYIQSYFCNKLDPEADAYFPDICKMKVSAHCLIDRIGKITQFVSFLDRAWHAGASRWKGQEACNDFSIGIELEGTDEQAYSDVQYENLASLVQCLRSQYSGINADAITGHSDIAPGRKTDPGPAFDWMKLKNSMQG